MPMAGNETNVSGIEPTIRALDSRIENLKSSYNMFFSGEIRIPPEKERIDVEKSLRILTNSSAKSPRDAMMIQNLTSKFSLYNNLWLKKLNELESGSPLLQRKKKPDAPASSPGENQAKKVAEVTISLTDENTFEKFYQVYRQLNPGSGKADQKEKIIQAIKATLISNRMAYARIEMSSRQGKINIKIKK
jgi:hypothetical protein